MTRLAWWESPGTYFIVCTNTSIVCGTIDTTEVVPLPAWRQ
ncbi:MAG TPA: hypothetical protein VMJ35_05515 [Dongiaceae bacterium]|nr:hypothetical protein [Dongiaceae bacterium]